MTKAIGIIDSTEYCSKKTRKFEWSVGTLVPSVLAVSLDNKISTFVIKII